MIIALAVPYLHGEGAIHDTSDNSGSMMKTLNEDEIYSNIQKERARLGSIMTAFIEGYAHSLLVKYADLNLTTEEREQRVQELMAGNTEEQEEAKELRDYGTVLYCITPTPRDPYGKSISGIAPDTEEFQVFARIKMALERILYEEQGVLVDIRDGEIRIAPDTEEYRELRQEFENMMEKSELTDEEAERMKQVIGEINQMAKTNTPTSIFQISPDVEKGRRKYQRMRLEIEKREVEKLLQEWEQKGTDEQRIQHLNASIKRLETSLEALDSQ